MLVTEFGGAAHLDNITQIGTIEAQERTLVRHNATERPDPEDRKALHLAHLPESRVASCSSSHTAPTPSAS